MTETQRRTMGVTNSARLSKAGPAAGQSAQRFMGTGTGQSRKSAMMGTRGAGMGARLEGRLSIILTVMRRTRLIRNVLSCELLIKSLHGFSLV